MIGMALLVVMVLLMLTAWLSYRCGICEGYCYAREPHNPHLAYVAAVVHARLATRYPDIARAKRRAKDQRRRRDDRRR